MKLERQIELMRELAHERHEGQFRNDGVTPYVTHVEAVADSVEDRLKPIALGHDLIEDTNVTLDELKKLKFPVRVILAIDLLTHKEGVSNIEYWKRISANADATAVNIADIRHNLSSNPSENAKAKYGRALVLFKSLGYST
jgi:(p)ppGpp synthase/HD superfamily hydrolase